MTGANGGFTLLNPAPLLTLTQEELVLRCATDAELFNHAFFPKTFRQASPPEHKIIDSLLEDPTKPYVNLRCYRGSSKTTKLRAFAAKRIAYALSHTILYIGPSEPHAIRSIRWIKNQVERNKLYAGTFGLRPGKTWQEANAEIIHGIDDRPIWILGVGITGNIRGINFDDYRPDLIILDDVLTDENTATLEHREKINDLILGAVKESLVPLTEEPNAKMANLQTPLHPEDATARMTQSRMWETYTLSCWTKDTEDAALEDQVSSWEERYPSAWLQKQKQMALEENRYSKWARENECRLISTELASFRTNWLGFYTEESMPKRTSNVLMIDPVPPPSDRQKMKGLRGKDFEAHVVVGRNAQDFYSLDVRTSRGHQPNWTVATALELAHLYRVMRICIIAVGYETTIEQLLKTEMARRGIFHAVKIHQLRQKEKIARITSALSGPASQGHIYVSSRHAGLIEQFGSYGPTYSGNDDILEAFAAGVLELTNPYLELEAEEYEDLVNLDEKFEFARGAP